jgi:branched-chain amino acid transport system ATP-binding protein
MLPWYMTSTQSLSNGRVVLDGSAETLHQNEDVKEFYLGLGAAGHRSYRDVKHYRRRKRWLA